MSRPSFRASFRAAWGVSSGFLAITLVVALAAWGPALLLYQLVTAVRAAPALRVLLGLLLFTPAYFVFAFQLMVVAAAVVRLMGWRLPAGSRLPLAQMDPELADWARGLAVVHVVRLFAGVCFRSTAVWNTYLRMNGARVGKRVWVNSMAIMDHHLIDMGDDVVIGSDVHLAGHSVERGILIGEPVRIGHRVTIGTGSVIGCGVVIPDDTQVPPLSVLSRKDKATRELAG